MRFGRKRSNWSNPARMFWGDRGDESNGAATLAPEEQAALRADLETESGDFGEAPMFTPEPTERLLSTLGKFQRQLSKAENGAASEEWTDECIDQIIQGIEIAHMNGWDAIQEALTDTARVLQSYEDVGRAADAVPFLHDSYEILCLIVGDIIVDSPGPSAVNKWRQRFKRALEDLDSAGIALVDDDGEAPSAPPAPAPVEEAMAESTQDMPLSNDWETALAERSDSLAPEAPWEDETEAPDTVSGDSAEDAFDEEGSEAYAYSSASDETTADEIAEEEGFILPALSEEQSTFADDEAEQHAVDDAPFDAANDALEVAEASPSEASFLAAPAQEDEAMPEAEASAPLDEDEDLVTAVDESEFSGDSEDIEDLADEAQDEPTEAFEDSETFDAVADPVSPESAALHQETLFDFDDTDTVAEEPLEDLATDQQDALLEAPSEDDAIEDLAVNDAAASEEMATVEALKDFAESEAPTVSTPPPDSPEALLLTVQQAMAQGDVAHAKALALKLAAQMAEMEVAKAQNTVQDAESLLAANRDAIAEAEAQVAAAEHALKEMEEAIAARQADAARQRDEMEKLRGEMSGVESEIAAIEARIRELEAQRDGEQAKLAALETTLSDQQAEESRIQTDLEALAEAEQSERERLDDARAEVGQLEQERSAREAAVAEAEKLLETRKTSAGEIARTLHPAEGA